ncbi:MAG TPA: ATP-binding protein [Candidatus Lokiarchaeia archaeon]|nr:ATP-binding protein [Candidatus Lokiarchaeia archaeon]
MIPEEKLDELFHSTTMPDDEKVDRLRELIYKYGETETSYLEWKLDEPQNTPLWKHLAAMSFHGHGYIVIGVSDDGDVVGLIKDKIKGMIKSIEDKRLGVYSFNGGNKMNDVVRIYPWIRVHPMFPPPHPSLIHDEFYLQVFEVNSESSFIYAKNSKDGTFLFWKRDGSSSIQCKPDTKEFLDQVIWKYDRGEKQRKIQECFDDIVQHIRLAIFDNYFKIDKETYWFNIKKRLESFEHKILNEDMKLVLAEFRGFSITLKDSIWHFPWSIRIALWDGENDDYYITRESRVKGNGRVQSMIEIREFFQEYSQLLANRFHIKIDFNDDQIPLPRVIREMIATDEKINDFTETKDSRRFIKYISEQISE